MAASTKIPEKYHLDYDDDAIEMEDEQETDEPNPCVREEYSEHEAPNSG